VGDAHGHQVADTTSSMSDTALKVARAPRWGALDGHERAAGKEAGDRTVEPSR
jgi:hypothetical protein